MPNMDDLSQFMIFISTTLVLASQSWMVEAVVSGPHPELLHHDLGVPSSKGNEFVLGFMGNSADAPVDSSTVALFVTTDNPSRVEFTVNYFGMNGTHETRKGRTTIVSLPVGRAGEIGDIRIQNEDERNKGILVRAADPTNLLTVYGINSVDVSADMFLALPCHRYPVKNYRYFVFSASTVSLIGTHRSRFLIVACEDNTMVTIRSTQQIQANTDLTGSPVPTLVNAGDSATLRMNRLDTAQFNSVMDLTGTIIESDKPISVFVGHECGQVPAGQTACDHLVEQIPPDATWGTQFFTVPLDVRESGEHYRIGTVTDNNQVTVTCTTEGQSAPSLQITRTIHSNQPRYVEFDTVGDFSDGVTPSYRRDFCCIETTKPAIVMMYSKGHSLDEITFSGLVGTQGDPFMLLVPPVSQYSNDYTITVPKPVRNNFIGYFSYALPLQFFDNSIISRNALTVNETTFIPDSGYSPIYCSGGQICGYGAYSGLPDGDHEVVYNMPGAAMMLYMYGFVREASFAYPARFEMQAIGAPRISIFNVTVLESVGIIQIPINRTGGDLSLRTTVRANSRDALALDGSDYMAISEFRIRWQEDQVDPRYIPTPSSADPVFQVSIIDDDIPEPFIEYFELVLTLNEGSSGRNGIFYPSAIGRVTIIDDDITSQIGFDPSVYDFNEDTGIATLFIITNVPDLVSAGGALFYTTDGTATSSGAQSDFSGITQANAEPIIFTDGPIVAISINITDDNLAEVGEHFSVHIISGGSTSNLNFSAPTAIVNIIDNDVGFEQSVFMVIEATRQYMLGVRVQQPDSDQIAGEAVFSISTMDGSAVSLQDYVNISNVYLNFSSGVQRRDVVVTILDDDMFEADEELYVMMSVVNTSDANIFIDVPMATVVINDLINIGFENERYNFTESINASACLTIRKFINPPTLADNITVRFLTMDGTAQGGHDFTIMDTTITLLPSESKRDICVTINEDLTLEESEIFYCSLSISQGSEYVAQVTSDSSQAIVIIVDNDIDTFEVQCNSEDISDRGNCSEYGLCKVMNTAESTTVECTSCADGFIGNGFLCEDIDECANRQDNCSVNANCTNQPGMFECVCTQGHFGNGYICINNENMIPGDTCDEQDRCCMCFNESSDVEVKCGCLPGCKKETEGDTSVCSDIDECSQGLCNGKCVNTVGSYHCSCPVGFFYDAEKRICADLDECLLGIHNCHVNATCNNTRGSFNCLCNITGGFFGDGINCFDDRLKCEQLLIDVNGNTSFECGCQVGYHLNRSNFQQCEDVDECKLEIDICDGNAECINTDGSYTCECKSGFMGDGTICNDIDECAIGRDRCDKNANCSNTFGNHTCQCRDGFFEDGTICDAGIGPVINTSEIRVRPNRDLKYTIGTNFCLETQSPMNTIMGQYWVVSCQLSNNPIPSPVFMMTIEAVKTEIETELSMPSDMELIFLDLNSTINSLMEQDTSAIRVTCIVSNDFGSDNATTMIKPCDIDECQDGITNGCTQLCSRDNETMTYNCSCIGGYIIVNETDCDDLNECADPSSNNCSLADNQECINTLGSFICQCNAGYSMQSGGGCEDIDECMDATLNNCSEASERCQNTNGSFVCVCMDGYHRINTTQQCVDINECSENIHTCSVSKNEVCDNTIGAFTCSCHQGYSRNASSGLCSDLDECDDFEIHQCSQICRNFIGSYECDCEDGYVLSSNNRQCIDIDECKDVDTICPTTDNRKCRNTNGSYSCDCIPGYVESVPNGICRDSRECDPPCHRFAECTNTSSGTLACQCRTGYDGDGTTNCQVSATIIYGTLGGVSFVLLTAIVITVTVICLHRCYTRRSSYDTTAKDTHGIQGLSLEDQHGESNQTFTVQTSYKLNLPPSLILHSSSIKLVETIGQGEFGIVYKGHILKDPGPVVTDIVAIKTLKGFYDKSTVRELMKECSKMYKFDHPNVLTLKGVCLDGGPAPYIIMPFMANGSLLMYLHKKRDSLTITKGDKDDEEVKHVEKQLMDMCLQIAKGMEYLTVMKVVHRDLAARNCMIDMNFVIKVADFGLSESIGSKEYFRQDKFSGVKLPIRWLAPESLEDCVFSQKSDVWAYGVTCWEVFTGGKTPYPGISPANIPQQLASGYRLQKPMNIACNDEMYDFMHNCWKLDPSSRPSFSELVSLLSQYLQAMAGYMDAFTFEKQEDKSSEVRVPSSEDTPYNLEDISSDIHAETVM